MNDEQMLTDVRLLSSMTKINVVEKEKRSRGRGHRERGRKQCRINVIYVCHLYRSC